ncbi:cysteine peptidase family C39 domain-containing protein [Rhizobium sp. AQ_MP]|uniref:cysteine peptidase family C39 domain-containing protein n=1 Tax=Rhizobium sp. AQ_MP TaxID=2761536 RepID=UPI00163AEBEB
MIFHRSKVKHQLNQLERRHQGHIGTLARLIGAFSFSRGGTAATHTPQLRQSAVTECGLTALAIIFAWHGVDVPLEKLRHEIGSSRLGLTARQLLELARRYDFDTKAYRRDIDQLATLPRPFIAHSRFIHFVVVEDVSDRHVVVNDPARGPLRLTLEEFARDFTGVALTFVPRRTQMPPQHPARQEFWLQLSIDRLPATVFFCLCLLQMAALVSGLLTLAPVVDGASPLGHALMIGGVAVILQVLLHWSIDVWTDRLARQTQELAWHRFRNMPPHWFAAKTPSQLADIMVLGERWLSLLPDILSLARSLLFLPILMIAPWLSLWSGLLVMSLTGIASWITLSACLRRGETRMRPMGPDRLVALPDAQILADLESRQFGARDCELVAQLVGEHARIHSEAQANLDWQTKVDIWVALPLTIALAVSMGEGLLTDNWGTAAALGTVCVTIGSCLISTRRNFPAVNDLMGLLSRLHDLRQTGGNLAVSEERQETYGILRIELSQTDLSLRRGDLLKLTGPSGSGKTRLARQIAGLEPCLRGAITYGGTATETLCHQGSSQVMLVDQQVVLISASVAENLRLGEARFERAALDRVLDLVELKRELDPRGGLDLMLSAERPMLSGGQLRRLALARALLRQPRVIVLDGTLDALDARLAERIVERLSERHILVLVGERGTEARQPTANIEMGKL